MSWSLRLSGGADVGKEFLLDKFALFVEGLDETDAAVTVSRNGRRNLEIKERCD